MYLTYRYRIKDGSCSTRRALRAQARAVNYVWNFLVATDREAYARYKAGRKVRRPTAFDLIKLCTGTSRELGLHSDTINAVCQRFVAARDAIFPKSPRFRSYKRNADWIPCSTFDRAIKLEGAKLTFLKRAYHLWLSRPLPERRKSWSFSTDSRGRWYINIVVEVDEAAKREGPPVGIDLGLKTLATLSDGSTVEHPALYRASEAQLGILQRRKQKVRARALAAKVANQRKHFLHVASTKIVRDYAQIVVGDVNAAGLKQTKMAKSVSDAGWSMFRSMLQYKAVAQGASFQIVSERMSTQTCSDCGVIGGPRGFEGLRMRHWTCSDCGASHDRDQNAARNILRVGAEHRPLVEEIPVL